MLPIEIITSLFITRLSDTGGASTIIIIERARTYAIIIERVYAIIIEVWGAYKGQGYMARGKAVSKHFHSACGLADPVRGLRLQVMYADCGCNCNIQIIRTYNVYIIYHIHLCHRIYTKGLRSFPLDSLCRRFHLWTPNFIFFLYFLSQCSSYAFVQLTISPNSFNLKVIVQEFSPWPCRDHNVQYKIFNSTIKCCGGKPILCHISF